MGFNPFGSRLPATEALRPTRIAKVLRVAQETVRERIHRMEKRGIIVGYQANPNLRLFGLETTSYLYRPGENLGRDRWTEALSTIDYLLQIHHFLEGSVCIDLCFRSQPDLDRRLQLISHVLGDDQPTRFFAWPMPPARKKLTNLEWRILRALRGGAKRPLPEVGKDLGVPYRTVKRHHDEMAKNGGFSVHPIVHPGHDAGLIPFWLLLYFRKDAKPNTPEAVVKEFQDRYVYADVPPTPEFGNLGLIVFADTPAQIEELRRRGANQPGVERASAMVPYDVTDRGEWLDDLIDEKILETAN